MPVRLRITLFFAGIVAALLVIIAVSVYYVSYSSRVRTVKTRLTNRALTTARLWNQYETFNPALIQKIDAANTMSLQAKVIQVYEEASNKIVYTFSDNTGDVLALDTMILAKARAEGNSYLQINGRDVVLHYYTIGTEPILIVAGAYDKDGGEQLHQLVIILWICFAGGLCIAIIAGYVFSKSLLLPVRKIADEVNEISAQNLTTRIRTGGTSDEWGYMAGTFNQLLDRLQESFEIQRRFVANASHELSTPLTSISSQLEVSLQRQREASEYRRVMLSVYQDVRQLNKLVQTLLEFAKASGSPGGLQIEKIRIDEVVMRMPGDISRTNVEYSVLLDFEKLPEEEALLWVLGNEDLLYTAIKNIIVNACKYSSNHQAKVAISTSGQQVIVTIADEGKGIPKEEMDRIFQPFYRTEDSRAIDGFGLGLSLANRIVKLHKGDITADSVVGKGTTFAIHLPTAENRLFPEK